MWFSGPVAAFPLSYIAGPSPLRLSRLCRISALPCVICVMVLAAYFFSAPMQTAGVLSTSVLIGCVVFGTYPLGLELIVESTYPVDETVGCAMIELSGKHKMYQQLISQATLIGYCLIDLI